MNLKDSIVKVIKRNSNSLINNKVKIELNNIDKIVYADSKWIEFIINQIITNSIKYMEKEDKVLNIYSEEKNNNIILYINDNGIGMDEKGVLKAFDKGYTGENGRKYGRSTGIGLYLCKSLCSKLGLGINLESEVGVGTTVKIMFPINKMISF